MIAKSQTFFDRQLRLWKQKRSNPEIGLGDLIEELASSVQAAALPVAHEPVETICVAPAVPMPGIEAIMSKDT